MILNLRVITLGTNETRQIIVTSREEPTERTRINFDYANGPLFSFSFFLSSSSVREATWTLTGAQLHRRIRERYVWHARTNPIEANLKF